MYVCTYVCILPTYRSPYVGRRGDTASSAIKAKDLCKAVCLSALSSESLTTFISRQLTGSIKARQAYLMLVNL